MPDQQDKRNDTTIFKEEFRLENPSKLLPSIDSLLVKIEYNDKVEFCPIFSIITGHSWGGKTVT